jgi:ABC-type phosphate transport system permease subunit
LAARESPQPLKRVANWVFYYMKYGVISEKEIIITLLASTTASIIGLPFAINKSIFIDKEK